jgi:hypothetical protein
MISTDEGIQIDESDEQYPNADCSIRESLDSLSKLTFDKVRQFQKLPPQMISTDEGIQIDESDEQCANAHFSIRESLDSFSKLTFDKVRHSQKLGSQMISTEDGMRLSRFTSSDSRTLVSFTSLPVKTRPSKQITLRAISAVAPVGRTQETFSPSISYSTPSNFIEKISADESSCDMDSLNIELSDRRRCPQF